ncbi:unnamed protein product [Amoebophrya sp. A120]|nr:unnamed protein product [Amoebophrya sp. A120]|eukprot:GSA120T00003323001.1
MASSSSSTSTVRIRNFSGQEIAMAASPEVCTTIGDLVDEFYNQKLVAKFLEPGQLVPPKHRLKWLKLQDEESEDDEDVADEFLPTNAELDFISAGIVYQFVIVVSRDWKEQMEPLKVPAVELPVGTAADPETLLQGRELPGLDFTHQERVHGFFTRMSLRDAEDFLYDRAYLIPVKKNHDPFGSLYQTEPWDMVLEKLCDNLPHRRDITTCLAEPYLKSIPGREVWVLVEAALKLPVSEWEKHGKDSQFFPLAEREEYAGAVVSQLFLQPAPIKDKATERDVFEIALHASEISPGTAAKLVAQSCAPPDAEKNKYKGWFGDEIHSKERLFSPQLRTVSSYRGFVSMLLSEMQGRGKLPAFLTALCRTLEVAALKQGWQTLPLDFKLLLRLQMLDTNSKNTAVRSRLDSLAIGIGGQLAAAHELLQFVGSHSQVVQVLHAEAGADVTSVIKEMEEEIAAMKIDVVSVWEGIGFHTRIEEELPKCGSTLSWADCVAHLRKKFHPEPQNVPTSNAGGGQNNFDTLQLLPISDESNGELESFSGESEED